MTNLQALYHTVLTRYLQRGISLCLYTLTCTLLLNQPASAVEEIIVWNRTYDQANMLDVLHLSLAKTATSETDKLVRSKEMEQGRVMTELQKNNYVDVAAFAPTSNRETQAIAIRIPVSKGLLGFRVCLIRKGDEEKFSNINTLEDWINSGLKIGQGTHWPDTPILESNGFEVVKSVRYKPLFHMLEKKRFDCFPRSINEVFSELGLAENSNLALEKHLLFRYRQPTFFFVNIHKPQLAERIERGMNIAIKDGSFDKLFYQHNSAALERINISQRQIIDLDNPYLSEKTQGTSEKPELWLQPAN